VSLRTDLLPVIDELRALAGPTGFDVRTSQLTIRTRTWAGGRRGLGPISDSDLTLEKRYKIRELSLREVSGSGGAFEMGDVKVGPITPTDVSGDLAGEYARIDFDQTKPFSWYMTLRKRRTTP